MQKLKFCTNTKTQVEISSTEVDKRNGETKVKTSFQPPLQLVSSPPKVKHNVLHAPLENAPPSPNMDFNNKPVFDSLCKAMSQQANVTERLVKNHKAALLLDLTISTFKGDPLEYNTFIRSIEHGKLH